MYPNGWITENVRGIPIEIQPFDAQQKRAALTLGTSNRLAFGYGLAHMKNLLYDLMDSVFFPFPGQGHFADGMVGTLTGLLDQV